VDRIHGGRLLWGGLAFAIVLGGSGGLLACTPASQDASPREKLVIALRYRVDLDPSTGSTIRDHTIAIMKKRLEALKLPSHEVVATGPDEIEVRLPRLDEEQLKSVKRVLVSPGTLELRIVARDQDLAAAGIDLAAETKRRLEAERATRRGEADAAIYRGPVEKSIGWYYFEDPSRHSGPPGLYVLLGPDYGLTGEDIERVGPDLDAQNRLAVRFSVKDAAQDKLGRLTETHIGRELAIILNGKIDSAPTIQDRITTDGIIRGGGDGFTPEEVNDLIACLHAGSLEITPRFLGQSEL